MPEYRPPFTIYSAISQSDEMREYHGLVIRFKWPQDRSELAISRITCLGFDIFWLLRPFISVRLVSIFELSVSNPSRPPLG